TERLVFLLHCSTSAPLFPFTTLFRSNSSLSQRSESVSRAQRSVQVALPPEPSANRSASRTVSVSSAPPSNTTLRKVGLGSSLLRSEEHTSELQSREKRVCRLLLEKNK